MHFNLPVWVLEVQWDKIKSISFHTDYPFFYPQPPEKQRIRGIFCKKKSVLQDLVRILVDQCEDKYSYGTIPAKCNAFG